MAAACWGLGKLLQAVSWQSRLAPGKVPASSSSFGTGSQQPQELARVTNSRHPSTATVQPATLCRAARSTLPWSWGGTDPQTGDATSMVTSTPRPAGAIPQLAQPASNKGWPRARLALPSAPRKQFPARETSTSARSSPSEHPGLKRHPGRLPASTDKRKRGTLLLCSPGDAGASPSQPQHDAGKKHLRLPLGRWVLLSLVTTQACYWQQYCIRREVLGYLGHLLSFVWLGSAARGLSRSRQAAIVKHRDAQGCKQHCL